MPARAPSPSSSDLFISGISEYLTSPPFLSTISGFVDSHCCMFDSSHDYSPGQHAIFIEFRLKVEKMIEGTLATLGGDSEMFFEAIKSEEFKDTPRVINVIDTLRSLDDFVAFHDNMVARNVELERLEEREIEGVPSPAAAPLNNYESESKSIVDEGVSQKRTASNGNSVPQVSFKDFDFEMLHSMASNLILNCSTATLSPYDNLMIPWAEAVLGVRDEMESDMVDNDRKADIMRELARHKLKVDFILASKFVNDRRAGVVAHLDVKHTKAEKVELLLNELHDLRVEVAKYRGEAVGYNNSGVSESNLENVYFRFKEFLQGDKDPTSNLDHILNITSEYVEMNDVDILVVMLKWLEMEKLIAEVHKRINKLLNEEEGGDEEEVAEAAPPVVEEVKEEEKVQAVVPEYKGEVGGLVDSEDEAAAEVNDNDNNEEGQEGKLSWIEQYDAESGYNFYYNTKTFETQWEPPTDEAYVPVTLDAMGYEMVEEEEGGEEDGNADWEWDEEGGKWVFKGEGADVEEGGGEQEEEDSKPLARTDPADTAEGETVVEKLRSAAPMSLVDDDDDEPLTLQVNSAPSPLVPGPALEPTPAPPSSSKERDSVNKKKKKKKKKFVVRAKAETPKEGEPPSSAIPFYLA
ncbi:hypothetical protein TrST_g12269 [Triparma strigata]|uniref:Cilia- and flagella-associated protein 36 n=1 Tax=Triparma strigata TaxID=1606541 RepID=A0A9W7BG85_9STRA|nr:hypothetical protein TrST_g12269 [Triparma strigata]